MRKGKHLYTSSPTYKKWVKSRDQALELLHHRAQLESTDLMRMALAHILIVAKSSYHELKQSPHSIDHFERQVKEVLRNIGHRLVDVMNMMRVRTYVLSKASQTEIIAQVNKTKKVDNKVTYNDVAQVLSKPAFAGGKLNLRIQLYMDRLSRRIISMAQASALNTDKVDDFLLDLYQAFPKQRSVNVPRRILKPKLMEADDKKTKVDVAVDLIDESQWEDMLSAYKKEYIPQWRGPEDVVDIKTTDGDVWYAWELERDLTNEFVSEVRAGENQAAKDAGITDFVWIAVVDSHTDACCLWRDGLLLSEIEARLPEHEGEDSECNLDGNGLSVPAHFNCRCTLAPATSEIPDKPDDGAKDFEDWLNS